MENCIIPYSQNRLRKNFNKDGDYKALAKNFLDTKGEGYFFNVDKAASEIEARGGKTPFSPSRFISTVNAMNRNNIVDSRNEFFSKDISELYGSANDPLSYMYNSMEQNLVKSAFIDIDAGTLTINDSQLNASIQGYKNRLFKKAFEYVKKNKKEEYKGISYSPLYEGKRYNPDSNYNQVMSDLSEIFESKEYVKNIDKISIYNNIERDVLDIYNAGVILSNFDQLIESRLNNVVSVNQNNFNNLNNPMNTFQYFLEFKGLETTYWKESSHEAEGIENYASNFIKLISSTIPLLNIHGKEVPNMYLGMNGISLIGVLVKNLNNEDFDADNFQENPKKHLRKFVNTLKKDGTLTYNAKVNSLSQYLSKVRKIINRSVANNPSLSDSIIDIEAVIAHQINNTTAPNYGIVDLSEGKKMISLVSRDLQGDEIRKQTLDSILQSSNMYDSIVVKENDVFVNDVHINKLGTDLSTDDRKMLKNLTGMDVSAEFGNILNMTMNAKSHGPNYLGEAFADTLRKGKEIVELYNKDSDVEPDVLLAKLNESTKIVDLITAGIAILNPEANMTFKSAEGNAIPTVKISNIAHEKKTVVKLAKKHFDGLDSLFLSHPNLYKGTETVLEVVKDGRATEALALNPEENFVMSFVTNYLNPMQMTKEESDANEIYTSFKLTNYSDKSTVLHEMIDHNLDINGKGSLREMPLNTLKDLNRSYLNTYYQNLIEKIGWNYGQLLKLDGKKAIPGLQKNLDSGDFKTAINKINKFLEKNGKKGFKELEKHTWKTIDTKNREALKNGKKPQKNVSFVDEVMYSVYGNGLRFNNTISGYFFGTQESVPEGYNDINRLAEQLFVHKLLEIKPNILSIGNIFDNIGQQYLTDLYSNMGLEIDDWISFDGGAAKQFTLFKHEVDGKMEHVTTDSLSEIDVNDFKLKSDSLNSVEVNPLVAKWLHTQNLVRYNSLALSTKHEYQHPHKTWKNSDMDFVEEMSGRSVSMTKRMVIHPATMEYYMQGLDNGIPPTIKLALLNDAEVKSYNFSGDLKGHDAWDGSVYANPFMNYLLKNSFPAKGVSDVQKPIGTFSTDTHSVFMKCALFTFNNELIRKSINTSINLDNVMKSMNNIDISDIDVSRNSKDNNLINFDQLVPDGIYYDNGGYNLKVERIKKIDNGNYIVTTSDEIGATGDKEVEINTLYDLWQVFGGAYSKSNIGGNLEYSDASTDAVGAITSVVSNGELKERMIGILANKSAIKNGSTNINNPAELESDNPTLMYTDFDTNFLGIQLDANHASDESKVNEISQVISALVENQSTPELYSELYSAIGEIINGEVQKYNKKFRKEGADGTLEFDREALVKNFIQVLSKKEQNGNANEIIELLKKTTGDNLTSIPVSNSNFFGPFVIDVISKLKTDFIKRKYPGISAVLNPSYGMLQVYEDDNGNTYFHDDLLNIADDDDNPVNKLTKQLSEWDSLDEEGLQNIRSQIEAFDKKPINKRNAEIVNNVISRMFPNKILSPDEYGTIKPLDNIIITDSEGNISNENLKDINDYYRVKNLLADVGDSVTVEIVKNKPRDLKPVEISFIQNGVQKNIFDIDSIRLTWAYNKILKDGIKETPEKDLAILQNFANFFMNADVDLTDKANSEFIKGKLKLWSKRSFELLSTGNSFVEANESTNFAQYFAGDTLLTKLPKDYKGLYEPISNYVHKPAEVVMPKIYRSQFNIGHKSFSEIQSKKETYFTDKLGGNIDPLLTDVDMFVSSIDGDHTYISMLSAKEVGEKGLIRKKILTKDIDGETWRVTLKGDKIYKLPNEARVYTKDGIEVIVFNKTKKTLKSINEFVKQLDSYFAHTFAVDTPKYINELKSISDRKNPRSLRGLEGTFDENKSQIVSNLAASMYSSWSKSNDMTVARIPSQAMQSFMSMKNIGYTDDPGNNVYVSHWQIWLQGSDFDIDKGYIMMHGFKKGVYEGWSPFFDHSSYGSLAASEKLPVPNKKVYKIDENGFDLSEDLEVLGNSDMELPFIEIVLNKVKSFSSIKPLDHPRLNEVIDMINEHNSFNYSQDSLKNYVVRNIIETSNNPKNQLSSYSPITFGKLEDIKKERQKSFILSSMDGMSMDQQQETNAVGKDVIGVAANGIKDYFSLMQFFSGYYNEGKFLKESNGYFEKEITLAGEGSKRIVNRIAGQNIDKRGIEILNSYVNQQLETIADKIIDKDGNIIESILDPYSDPAMALSSLLSAATDNAKELILKTINAGKDFAAMHVYLIILGFNEGDVARFMTHPDIISFMDNELKSNVFIPGLERANTDSVVNSILDPELPSAKPSKNNYGDSSTLLEFKKIYNLSKELTSLAKRLKINQGLKASPDVLYTYFKSIEDDFVKREIQFSADNFPTVVKNQGLNIKEDKAQDYMLDMVMEDKPYLKGKKKYVSTVLNTATALRIPNGGFSFESYFSNEEYREAAINYYNLIKGTYNVLAVIEELDHFKGMINAAKLSYDSIKSVSKKFNFVVDDVPKILSESTIETVPFRIRGTENISLSEQQSLNARNIYDHLMITKWFKAYIGIDPKNSFDLNQVQELTNEHVTYYDENGKLLDLNNDSVKIDFSESLMLENFTRIMEQNILPYLKRTYSDNQFINGLVLRQDAKKVRSWISTKVRMNRLTDPKNLDMLHNYQKDFNQLFEDNVEIKLGDNRFNVADLFFMYNLIVNQDKAGADRLTKLFGNYVSNPNSISKSFYEMNDRIDKGTEQLFDELMPLDKNMKEIIEFGTLQKNGQLEVTKAGPETDAVVKRLANPNFSLMTTLVNTSSDYKNLSAFRKILAGINDKNLVIEFKCDE